MARFYIGQPVVCVRDNILRGVAARYPGLMWPRKGVVYHVRENYDSGTPNLGVLTFVTLRELRNRRIRWPNGALREAGFWEERFEPATDIGELDEVRKTVERYMGNDGPEQPAKAKPRRVRKKEDA
jgi:hypothetical protein